MNPLDSARAELGNLLKQQANIASRIAAVQEAIRALEPLYGSQSAPTIVQSRRIRGQQIGIYPPDHPMIQAVIQSAMMSGLTDRVRTVLRAAFSRALSPVEVRDAVVESGFNVPPGRSNFMAEIHTILKRLETQGDITSTDTEQGKKYCHVFRLGKGALVVAEVPDLAEPPKPDPAESLKEK